MMETLKLCLSTAPTIYSDMPLQDMLESPETPSPVLAKEEEHPCTECGKQRYRRGSVASSPRHANAGRTYFPCTNSRCRKGSARLMQRDFVTWDAHGESPKCDCGLPSRQGRLGLDDPKPGYGYWECAFGSCKYHSRDRKGRTVENGEVKPDQVQPFIPWLVYSDVK